MRFKVEKCLLFSPFISRFLKPNKGVLIQKRITTQKGHPPTWTYQLKSVINNIFLIFFNIISQVLYVCRYLSLEVNYSDLKSVRICICITVPILHLLFLRHVIIIVSSPIQLMWNVNVSTINK